MHLFVISTAIDVNRAVELVNTIPMLGFSNDNVEVVIADPDPNKSSVIILFFGDWAKIQFFWQGCQYCIIRVHRNVIKKNKSQGNYFLYHFRTFSENIPAFCQKFFGRVVKTAFYASMTTFWKIFVEASYFFICFGNWAKNFLAPGTIFFGRVVKTALYVSVGTILKTKN